MCTQVRASFTDAAGRPVDIDFYATLQRLADDAPQGKPTPPERPRALVVPEAQRQGDTNQTLVEHFDRLAGREIASRPVAAEVAWKPEELNEAWIRQAPDRPALPRLPRAGDAARLQHRGRLAGEDPAGGSGDQSALRHGPHRQHAAVSAAGDSSRIAGRAVRVDPSRRALGREGSSLPTGCDVGNLVARAPADGKVAAKIE
jgi:hypothetical protein